MDSSSSAPLTSSPPPSDPLKTGASVLTEPATSSAIASPKTKTTVSSTDGITFQETTAGIDKTKDLHYKHALNAVLYAMLFNGLIAASKIVVASTITRSAALFSEGLHSAADTFNSFTLLFGIIQGKRPPDRSHHFGYGLEANFWALLASFILFVSALVSVYMGVERLVHPSKELGDITWAIVILVLSVFFEIGALTAASNAVLQEAGNGEKVSVWAMFPKALKRVKFVTSPTTRFVFFEDLIAFTGALIALFALLIGEWGVHAKWLTPTQAQIPDAIASVVIGILLMVLAVNLFSYNRSFLTGVSASSKTEKSLSDVVSKTHGVASIMDLKTIDQGISGLFVQLKVQVDPDIPIRQMDDIIDHLKERIQSTHPRVRDVVVEVEADESEATWRESFDKLVEEGQIQQVIAPQEGVMLSNVMAFSERVVSDVMIPRTDVVMVDFDTPVLEVAKLFTEHRHSKLPVYKETIDQLEGVIHEREVLKCLADEDTAMRLKPNLAGLLKDIPIYPENKTLTALLEDLKRSKFQMAAVIDEHGGFAGLVTVADLMEELVGELWEDADEQGDEDELVSLSPTHWIVPGRYLIEDLNAELNLHIPEDDFKTIAGFVFGQLGREPEPNDSIFFEGMTITVQELEGHRIKTVVLVSELPLERQPEIL